MSKGKVIVAMSGGVDSSVAALLLKRQGYDVIGITMRLWTVERDDLPSLNKRCCSVEDITDAQKVCQAIGVPHYVQNFEREFQQHVVDYFVREYDRGRTPHPCLACNDKLKFDFLLRRAMFLDADYIATGHYARLRHDGNQIKLLKGADPTKDQSYVLFTLRQAELRKLLLPVGEYPKAHIREIAGEADLPVADKPDSQEICFIPDGDYRKFVGDRNKPKPGPILDSQGQVLGQHPGVHFFTVGQRRGLGIQGNSGNPLYVVSIDGEKNEVVLGPERDLYRSVLWASQVNYTGQLPIGPTRVTAKIRYKASESAGLLLANGKWAELRFDEPQKAVTPGQAVVFYSGEEVMGGGYIEIRQPNGGSVADETHENVASS
ncbi:MAG: tRNA 2-thiouridine(34) synthase MnmA [SAR202 cluster bacterium]|nr:tRNA 2-thiouridine(34) synthase MnmA [SAR202 cluster bacterium]